MPTNTCGIDRTVNKDEEKWERREEEGGGGRGRKGKAVGGRKLDAKGGGRQ